MERILLVFCAVILLATPALTGESAGEEDATRKAILETIEHYVKGTDTRDVERVSKSSHEQGWHFANTPRGLVIAQNQQYVTNLGEGKIGGQERTFKVISLDVSNNLVAYAKVEAATPRATFTHYFGLITVEERWQIVSVVTSLVFTATD